MMQRRFALAAAGGVLIGALALLAGCASTPVVERFSDIPNGTVGVFTRKSTGSFGSGEARVVWTHGEAQFQGRRVLSTVSPTAGTAYYDPATYGQVASLSPAGVTTATYDPPLGNPWPLSVGRTWTTRHMVVTPQRTLPLEVKGTVEAYEEITVPAGTYKTFRVVTVDSLGERTTVWTAPQSGIMIVRRQIERPASHPLGAGTLEGQLIERRVPR